MIFRRIQRGGWPALALVGMLACGTFPLLPGDDIYLLDGAKISGEIVGETDTEYTVRRGETTFKILKTEVAKIVKKTVAPSEYQGRFDKIAKDDAKGYWELAVWCKQNGLYEKYQMLARTVIELSPDHADAHAALGQKKINGKWVTDEEAKIADGWHKDATGKWISPEEWGLVQAREAEKTATQKYYLDMEKELVDLGSQDGDKFDAALKRAQTRGEEAHPLLYKFMLTKAKREEIPLRIGSIKAFAAINKITQYSQAGLVRVALRDLDERVRKEAARAIKTMNDNGAVNLLLQQVVDDASPNYYYAAMALKEIDNNDAFQVMINAITAPEKQTSGALGGGGMTVTVANGVDAGPLKALKWIAGKDLGSSRQVWQEWLDQKTGRVNKSAPNQNNELRKIP